MFDVWPQESLQSLADALGQPARSIDSYVALNLSAVTRAAQVAFAVLVAATLAAFFVTQRLKQSSRLVQTLAVTHYYSPHLKFKRASIRIRLTRRADDATVSILGPDGDPVRRLVANRHYARHAVIQLLWNGRDDAGRIVPDGIYKIRVSLRHQGRSVTLLDEIHVDGTPPRPIVRVQKPGGGSGPLIFPLPGGGPVRFTLRDPGAVGTPVFRVYRTDLPKARGVARLPAGPGAKGGTWDGSVARDAGGPAPPPGVYVIVARVSDRAGSSQYGDLCVGCGDARDLGENPGVEGVAARQQHGRHVRPVGGQRRRRGGVGEIRRRCEEDVAHRSVGEHVAAEVDRRADRVGAGDASRTGGLFCPDGGQPVQASVGPVRCDVLVGLVVAEHQSNLKAEVAGQ